MTISKSENAEMTSCPVDEETGVESSSGMSKIIMLVGFSARAKCQSPAPQSYVLPRLVFYSVG